MSSSSLLNTDLWFICSIIYESSVTQSSADTDMLVCRHPCRTLSADKDADTDIEKYVEADTDADKDTPKMKIADKDADTDKDKK